MLLNLLRCLRGYVCFTVCGTYPERFINIALKNRLRLWNVVRGGDGLTACMYMRDYLRVRRYARASGVRLKISGRKGLPTLLRRYSNRVGLVIGAAAFVITVFVMSLFVWSIDITGLEDISESEMRALLAEKLQAKIEGPKVDDLPDKHEGLFSRIWGGIKSAFTPEQAPDSSTLVKWSTDETGPSWRDRASSRVS